MKIKKISLSLVNNLLEEEKEILKAIRFEERKTQNPYWGLKCNRGLWLTRFPKGSLPEDPEFTMAYVKADGGFDAMGHWGITPEHLRDLESQEWSYAELALLAQGVPERLCRFEGVTPKNYSTLQRGLNRADALEKMHVEYTCSKWTLGSMPIEKFLKRLFRNGLRVTGHSWKELEINHLLVYRPYYDGHRTVYGNINTALEAVSEGGEGRRLYNVEKILPEKFLEYCRKCSNLKIKDSNNYYVHPFIFNSLVAAKKFVEKAKLTPWGGSLEWGKFRFNGIKTSVGTIFPIHKQYLLVTDIESGHHDENGSWHEPKIISSLTVRSRQVAGYDVCKVGDTWFVWVGDFSNHIEGCGSLKSVIDRAEKRRKKNSLILTLNDVRNDQSGTAGFCLLGTKAFLQNRMPHVFRLISKYNSWSEIPEEIMSTEWALASRDIFNGYSSPIN